MNSLKMLHNNLMKQSPRPMRGEDIYEIVDQFHRDGEEHAIDDDSSDDEDNAPVPRNWNAKVEGFLGGKGSEHTCQLELLPPTHRNLTAGFVANYMYPHIVENSSYESTSIVCAVEEEYKYKIS